MRVYETTTHIGADGVLRLSMPVEERGRDVHVAVVVATAESRKTVVSGFSDAERSQLEAVGVRVPAAPSTRHVRGVRPLKLEGPSISQTLVDDRR